MVAAVDLELDDIIHVSTEGLKRLGNRLANLACRDAFEDLGSCRDLKRGPTPVSATAVEDVHVQETDNMLVRVEFSEVNAGLQSSGRVAGFSIHSPTGEIMPIIFKAEIDPENTTVVLLHVHARYSFGTRKLPQGATLRYGYGRDAYCNLRDKADLAVPVFGPMPIQ
jgi:sialate O-acetylesterase